MFEIMQLLLSQFLFNLGGIFNLKFGLDGAINAGTKSVTGQFTRRMISYLFQLCLRANKTLVFTAMLGRNFRIHKTMPCC